MIILITEWYDKNDIYGFKTGEKELLVSHGYDTTTGKTVILPNEHPALLGAKINEHIGEWVIDD